MYEKFYTTGTPSPIEVKAIHYKADASNQDEVVAFLREHATKYSHTYFGSADTIAVVRKFRPTGFIPSDNMVVAYPDGNFSHMGVTTFNSIFAPLPNGGKYYANDDEGVVEAYYFSADRSNIDDVLDFLRKLYAPFLTQTEHADTKAKLKCIAVPYRPGSIAYFYPGRVIAVSNHADFPVTSHELKDFHEKYAPYTESAHAPEPAPVTYYEHDDTHRTVAVMTYNRDCSNRAEVEAFINSRLSGASPWGDNYTHSAGARYEHIAISVPSYTDTRYLTPGSAVGIYTDNREFFCAPPGHFDIYFHRTSPPTEKETPVLTPTGPVTTGTLTAWSNEPESEYTINRNKVYDALAVLRTPNASDLDFEIATKDLMDLLADAYNKGYDFGLEVGQTNPYVDWR